MSRLLFGLLVFLFPILFPIASPVSSQDESQEPTFKARVDIVSLDVEALDDDENLIPDLTPADFAVEEDGRRMEISNFALATDRAVSLAVTLDLSALSPEQLGICKTFLMILSHKLAHSDELCFYSFDANDAYLEHDFTADRPSLMKALENIGVPSSRSGGLLRELMGKPPLAGLAIDLALSRLKTARNPKKALLVISNRFRGAGKGTVEHVQLSGCTLLTLSFPHKASKIATLGGDAMTTSQLMKESGGRRFSADVEDIDGVCRRIAGSLKNYYSIGYLTELQPDDKKPRRIRVDVPGRKCSVHFRRSYSPERRAHE